MPISRRIVIVGAAVVATLLQVLLAPYISIGYARPNFMVVLCIVVAVLQARGYGVVLPFVLGLVFDLFSGGPVGAMAFSLTAFSYATAWFCDRAGNNTLFMGLVALAVGLLIIEISYGVFVLLFGYSANYFEAFGMRTLPCYVYDLVLAVVGYLVARRFAYTGTPVQSEITQL